MVTSEGSLTAPMVSVGKLGYAESVRYFNPASCRS